VARSPLIVRAAGIAEADISTVISFRLYLRSSITLLYIVLVL